MILHLLRARAEAMVKRRDTDRTALDSDDAARLIHELRIQKVELELQTEELLRNQRELETARARLSHLFENAPVGYASVDGDGVIVEANLTLASALQIDRAFVVGARLESFCEAASTADLRACLALARDSGEPASARIPLLRGDRSVGYFHLQATVEAASTRCRCALVDITERLEAEARALELEGMIARQTNLVDQVSEAVVSTDLDHRIRTWNRAAEQIYGWPTREAIGRDIRELLDEDFTNGETFEQMTAAMTTRGRWSGEVKKRARGGDC